MKNTFYSLLTSIAIFICTEAKAQWVYGGNNATAGAFVGTIPGVLPSIDLVLKTQANLAMTYILDAASGKLNIQAGGNTVFLANAWSVVAGGNSNTIGVLTGTPITGAVISGGVGNTILLSC
jgi:hypothetical protein